MVKNLVFVFILMYCIGCSNTESKREVAIQEQDLLYLTSHCPLSSELEGILPLLLGLHGSSSFDHVSQSLESLLIDDNRHLEVSTVDDLPLSSGGAKSLFFSWVEQDWSAIVEIVFIEATLNGASLRYQFKDESKSAEVFLGIIEYLRCVLGGELRLEVHEPCFVTCCSKPPLLLTFQENYINIEVLFGQKEICTNNSVTSDFIELKRIIQQCLQD